MSIERIAVDVTKVSKGMYVSMLDRPWLETPFVFQGFEIRDTAEIELLQTYCSIVYVDISRGSLSEAEIRSLSDAHAVRLFQVPWKYFIETEMGCLDHRLLLTDFSKNDID